jgi:hypothetical protein
MLPGDVIMHDKRTSPILITAEVFVKKKVIGVTYVPWRDGEWARQTDPPRFIKFDSKFAGERINMASVRYVMDPRIKIVEV